MKAYDITISGLRVKTVKLNTVIVGSGAAAFGAADRLYSFGQKDIAIVTEGINTGTSRNAGSDKQTYYKLTLSGDGNDSVMAMAQNLFDGGAMDGDIALCEAALSAQSFYRLVEAGVEFPCNAYGEYVGYKTDHDPRQRATSAGPLTSKMMTEKLEEQVKNKDIKIFDKHMVIRVLTDGEKAVGVLCLDKEHSKDRDKRYVVFLSTNVIYATGGPAGIYSNSVYPVGHRGAHGWAFEAGVKGKNLTEWQYGIASIKFRWNLSGTYQQVLPTYISTDQNGNDAHEFLDEYFNDSQAMLNAIFLKGYQWPFDPRKIENKGSSLIDVLVYNEISVKGRRVWLDFRKNPSALKSDFTNVGKVCYEYLKNSQSLFGTPIERLKHMNTPAIELYQKHGIDIEQEMLEIAVCAQHNNGGLSADNRWESNILHFFTIGECSGTHGVYRPGGSALNSGQCGGLRATQYIAGIYNYENSDEISDITILQIKERIEQGEKVLKNTNGDNPCDIEKRIGDRMSRYAAHIRSFEGAKTVYEAAKAEYEKFWDNVAVKNAFELCRAFSDYELLITQQAVSYSIMDYIKQGGISRGSYLIADTDTALTDYVTCKVETEVPPCSKVQETEFKDGEMKCTWREVRPIPKTDNWFENVWNDYLKGKHLEKSEVK
ncbi:MAG: FAD-binding protein [Clostridia bacterium]|nr:FAD-binding protein [Clostridia bacterium]